MRKSSVVMLAMLPVVMMAAAACGDDSKNDVEQVNHQGAVVAVLDGDNYNDTFVLRRECHGTTAVYTMKDSSGYDFQVVPLDEACLPPAVLK